MNGVLMVLLKVTRKQLVHIIVKMHSMVYNGTIGKCILDAKHNHLTIMMPTFDTIKVSPLVSGNPTLQVSH